MCRDEQTLFSDLNLFSEAWDRKEIQKQQEIQREIVQIEEEAGAVQLSNKKESRGNTVVSISSSSSSSSNSSSSNDAVANNSPDIDAALSQELTKLQV